MFASIAPWKCPLKKVGVKLPPELAAGNSVVLMPSEITPLTAIKLAVLAKVIFPPGALHLSF